MNKILTISVASYNLESMIEENLTSIVNSKYIDDIEIIYTDDGGTDNTMNIVSEYAKRYPESIKMVYKVNEGPGSTVNSGIKNATGKYFKMIDGDDLVDTETLDFFIENLKNNNFKTNK